VNIQLLLDKTVISVLLVLNSSRHAIAMQSEPKLCWLVRSEVRLGLVVYGDPLALPHHLIS